jgi:nitroreductase
MPSPCLRDVITGCTVMTYGSCQRRPKSRASQSRSYSATRLRSTARRRRAVGARLFHLSPAGVTLPPTSATVEGAAGDQRTQAGVYGEITAQFDSAGAVVRICQEPVHQRGGQPCLAGIAATRARAWLRAEALETFAWNIGLIVCWKRSWHKSFQPWRRKSSASLAQAPKPRRP